MQTCKRLLSSLFTEAKVIQTHSILCM